jgi:hypothetical protein
VTYPNPILEELNSVPPTPEARKGYLSGCEDQKLRDIRDALEESIDGISAQLKAADDEFDLTGTDVDHAWIKRAQAAHRFKTLDLGHCKRILARRQEERSGDRV